MSRLPTTNLHRQRGAIGLMGTLTLLMAILFTALAVDSGRLWMQQKNLQVIADIAAIEAARSLGCAADVTDALAAAQAAAANNGYAGNLANSPNLVDLGSANSSSGIREFISGDGAAAVYVRATQEVPRSLVAGGLFGGNIMLSAEAVSLADPSLAAFSAGSYTASLNSEDSVLLNALLGNMLGAPLNLGVIGYQGIAQTNITLQDLLQVSADAGNYEDLLNSSVQVSELLQIFVDAATANGAADVQAIAAMQSIANAAVRDLSLRLGDVLAVTTAEANAAATVGLNALSLITTSVLVANGTHAVTLPLGINLASIASINALVTVVEPPQMALGPPANADGTICTSMKTAEVRVQVPVVVNIPLLARVDLSLNIEVAQGSADLLAIDSGDTSTDVQIAAQPGIASITLTNTAGTGPARISTLNLPLIPGIPIADIGLDLPVQPPGSETLDFSVAHPVADDLPQLQTVTSPLGSSLQNALSQSGALDITVLSILNLGLVNDVVSAVISPLLGEIGRVLLDPLLELLGIRLGGLDVTLEGVQYHYSSPLVI
ncbi:MAG: hypothetical protein CVU26_00400 [Betaproteobacteria bacterium HGW-Betaproteobacteria-2]|nr:MAG: hypothetical protein CVU26_00400 [Betaproteobacteria bacterium HGW-Betaproteobacteria-2]